MERAAHPWLTRNLIALGLVSLLTDAAGEMVVPLLPFFLTGALHAGPAAVGWIEGAADALASVLKLFAGRVADRLGRNRPLVLLGYGLSSSARPLMGFAGAWWHVLAVRLADRTGKGLRSSPRDAIIAASTPDAHHASAFGFHRAMDHLGAVIGPLVAMLVLASGAELSTVFKLTAIPGALAVLAIVLGVREDEPPPPATAPTPEAAPAEPPARKPLLGRPGPALGRLLVPLGVLALGRPNEAMLLPALGVDRVPLAAVPPLWIGLHVVKVLASLASGPLSARLGRRVVISLGWAVHVAALLALWRVESREAAWAVFLLAGLAPGLAEAPEKALVAEVAPQGERATAFGWFHLVTGLLALPASALFGVVWQRSGGGAALSTSACIALVGLWLFLLLARPVTPRVKGTANV